MWDACSSDFIDFDQKWLAVTRTIERSAEYRLGRIHERQIVAALGDSVGVPDERKWQVEREEICAARDIPNSQSKGRRCADSDAVNSTDHEQKPALITDR
jgi:hypothetical protein